MTEIDRRSILIGSAAALALAQSAKAQDAPASDAGPAIHRPKKPRGDRLNILLLVNDQQRAIADLPEELPLPAHDWLQEKGISFSHFHVNTTPCGPSRAVMYTGTHTQQNGMYANPNSPPFPQLSVDKTPTLGHILRKLGYRTPYKGKWHLSNINEGLQFRNVPTGLRPFDNTNDILEPYGFSNYNFNGEREGLTWEGFMNDGVTAAEAVNELYRLAEDDAPWFMSVNFVNPHDIMFYDATGKGEETRARPNLIAPLMEAPGHPIYQKDWNIPLPESFYKDDLSTKPMSQRATVAAAWAFYGKMPRSDEASWKRFQNYYFNCVRDVDRHMMTVLQALEASGQLDNTIILYTADHGERAGAHGMMQKAGTIYKEDVGVPFVVVHPDLPGARTTRALGSSVDLAPTILSMAGISDKERRAAYPQLVGHDLTPAIRSANARSGRDKAGVLFDYAVIYGWSYPDVPAGATETKPLPKPDLSLRRLHRGVHDGRYKFARYFAPAEHHIPDTFEDLVKHNDLELYDTEADPNEITNLATEPDKHRKLIERLNKQTNALIRAEIGTDDGAEYPGPVEQFNTLKLS